MRLRPAALLLLALAGCRADPLEDNVIHIPPEDPTWQLVVTTDLASVQAGNSVSWALVMVSDLGNTELVDGHLWSPAEPDLYVTDSLLVPTVAGEQELMATAEFDGIAYEASTSLVVTPGPVDLLDLQLSDLQISAGEPLDFEVHAWDVYGNDVDTTEVETWVDDEAVSIEGTQVGGTLRTTTPGVYTATSSLLDASDVETFVVVPGPAVGIDLKLSSEELELYETAVAHVTVVDTYGNVVNEPWTLSVDGSGATLAYTSITFWEEGWFTVRADLDDTTLYDEVGPFLIDSTGPVVTIDEPERGAWVEGESGTVSGTVTDEWSAVTDLTVNGQAVAVAGDGSFSSTAGYDFGMNVVETNAMDADGNTTTDTRALLAGDFLPYGEELGDGIAVRIHEGAGGLGELEDMAEGLIGATDLDAMIPSPVFSDSSESCIDLYFTEICITWYSATLYVTNPTISSTAASLDPTSGGYIDSTFTLYNPSIDWSASGKVIGIGYSGSGDITADSIAVSTDITPYIASHQLGVTVANTSVTSSNFDFDWDSWIYDVMSFFGLGLDSLIQGYMEDAIESAVEDEIPSLVSDALGDLEIGYDLELSGNTYAIDARPGSVSVDDTGITLGLDTTVLPAVWSHVDTGLGSLYGDYTVPTYTGSPGTILSIGEDFLNQVFYAMWGGGLLDMTMTGDDLGLDLSSLDMFLGEVDSLTIVVDPYLPPVVVPGTAGGLLDLQIGDLSLTIYNGDPADEDVIIQVFTTIVADLDLDASSSSTLSAGLGDLDTWFDVTVPANNTQGSADTEALLDALLPALLPTLTGALGEVPIPDMSGFTIKNISVSLAGPEDGYVNLGGDLDMN